MTGGRPTRVASSSLAIGVATVCITLAALFSLADEPVEHNLGWHLRGTFAPDNAEGTATRLPAALKRA